MITNYLSPVGFKVVIDRIPNVEFFTQRVAIPSVNMVGSTQASPLANIYNVPDRMEFAEFDLTFILDENAQNYKEIFDWMQGLASPQDMKTRKALSEGKDGNVSDISVLIENSSRNANLRFVFTDCFPVGLSTISLDATASDVIYPEVSATFRYTVMDFEKIS